MLELFVEIRLVTTVSSYRCQARAEFLMPRVFDTKKRTSDPRYWSAYGLNEAVDLPHFRKDFEEIACKFKETCQF